MTTFFIDAYVKLKEPDTMLFWPSVYPPGWFEVGPDNVFRVDAPIWLALLPPDSPTTKHPFVRTDPPTADPRAAADQLVGVINLDSGIRNSLLRRAELAAAYNAKMPIASKVQLATTLERVVPA